MRPRKTGLSPSVVSVEFDEALTAFATRAGWPGLGAWLGIKQALQATPDGRLPGNDVLKVLKAGGIQQAQGNDLLKLLAATGVIDAGALTEGIVMGVTVSAEAMRAERLRALNRQRVAKARARKIGSSDAEVVMHYNGFNALQPESFNALQPHQNGEISEISAAGANVTSSAKGRGDVRGEGISFPELHLGEDNTGSTSDAGVHAFKLKELNLKNRDSQKFAQEPAEDSPKTAPEPSPPNRPPEALSSTEAPKVNPEAKTSPQAKESPKKAPSNSKPEAHSKAVKNRRAEFEAARRQVVLAEHLRDPELEGYWQEWLEARFNLHKHPVNWLTYLQKQAKILGKMSHDVALFVIERTATAEYMGLIEAPTKTRLLNWLAARNGTVNDTQQSHANGNGFQPQAANAKRKSRYQLFDLQTSQQDSDDGGGGR